jgi:hypothetical protein
MKTLPPFKMSVNTRIYQFKHHNIQNACSLIATRLEDCSPISEIFHFSISLAGEPFYRKGFLHKLYPDISVLFLISDEPFLNYCNNAYTK